MISHIKLQFHFLMPVQTVKNLLECSIQASIFIASHYTCNILLTHIRIANPDEFGYKNLVQFKLAWKLS